MASPGQQSAAAPRAKGPTGLAGHGPASSSTTPTTRKNTRPTGRRSSRAGSRTASARERSSAPRNASPTVRARSRRSTSSAPRGRTRRSTSSSMAAPGVATGRPTMRCRPSCWSAPAPTASFSISSTWTKRAAACFRWPSRCVAPSPGSIATPPASAATPIASISAAIPRARISARCALTTDWSKEDLPADIIKGARAAERHVRPRAGAAVEALALRRVHRRNGREL